eukprot:g8223.t1
MSFHHHHGVRMMAAKGFGNQSNKIEPVSSPKASSKVDVAAPLAPKRPSVGDLPEDAFSQFPPLTEQQKKTLVGVQQGAGSGIPSEVRNRIRERHGFEGFDDKLFPGIRLLHADPVVFEVENFFTPQECDAYVAMSTVKQSGRRRANAELAEAVNEQLPSSCT